MSPLASAADLVQALTRFDQVRPICLLGRAVLDVSVAAQVLPARGGDVETTPRAMTIGGCAVNIAVALHRLGCKSINLIPLGTGLWAEMIDRGMTDVGISSALRKPQAVNGWSLVLVEPSGERTFISVDGVDDRLTKDDLDTVRLPSDAIVYLSGYDLVPASGAPILDWLETLAEQTDIVFDPGPRVDRLPASSLDRLYALGAILTVNRREAGVLAQGAGPEEAAHVLRQRTGAPVVVRLDGDGAFYAASAEDQGFVPAWPAQVVDSNGAGDTHTAAVIAGLAAGTSWPTMVAIGNLMASKVVARVGAHTSPTRAELLAYLAT